MNKNVKIFVIIAAALLALFLVYNYLTRMIAKTPAENTGKQEQNSGIFHGPTSAPSVKGPSGPPPSQ